MDLHVLFLGHLKYFQGNHMSVTYSECDVSNLIYITIKDNIYIVIETFSKLHPFSTT
jgi:ribosomal protein L31